MRSDHGFINLPDAELATQAVRGERAAMEVLLVRHYDLIYRVALRTLGQVEAAEDVAQDVCVKLGHGLGRWTGTAAFTTWLYRITLNAAHDHIRRRARDDRVRGEWARAQPEETAEAGQTGIEDARIEALWRAVRGLPPAQAKAVTLVYGEGLTHAQAALVMKCATATIGYHVHAARRRLRILMAEEAA